MKLGSFCDIIVVSSYFKIIKRAFDVFLARFFLIWFFLNGEFLKGSNINEPVSEKRDKDRCCFG